MGGSKDQKMSSKKRVALSPAQKTADIHSALDDALDNDLARTNSIRCKLLYFQVMSVFMDVLPNLEHYTRIVKDKILQCLLDTHVLRKLEEAKVINWCPSTKRIFPRWTRGDGNCLPHSVSLYLWGIPDDRLFLRNLIHETLSDPATSNHFRTRWEYTRRYHNSIIPEGGLEYDSQEWDREWAMIVDLATRVRQDIDPNNLPYHCLEEIHIFVLANLIRRPIIILSEGVFRQLDGSSLAPNNVGGIYLPTLCAAQVCEKSPVVICYDCNHFMPLLSIEDSESDNSRGEHAVPIVTHDITNLPVHFLSETEEGEVPELLKKYLKLIELQLGVDSEVLSVEIQPKKLPAHWNLMDDFCTTIENEVMDLENDVLRNIPSKETVEEKQETNKILAQSYAGRSNDVTRRMFETNEQRDIVEVQEKLPLAIEVQRLAAMESHPCVTPGCDFHGLPENGGRCSVCVKDFTSVKATNPSEETELKALKSSKSGNGYSPRRTGSYRKSPSRVKGAEPDPIGLEMRTTVHNDHAPCIESGCDILASHATYPYCIIHQPRGAIISTVRENKKQHSGSVSAYYARHVTPEPVQETRFESHSLESVQREYPKMCLVGGCTQYGDPSKQTMCALHSEGYVASHKKEQNKKIFSEQASKNSSKMNKEALPIELMFCLNKRCAAHAEEAFQGYCRDCFPHKDTIQNQQNEQQLNLMGTCYQKPSDRPKSWAPNARNTLEAAMDPKVAARKSNTVSSVSKSSSKPSNLTGNDRQQKIQQAPKVVSNPMQYREPGLPVEESGHVYDTKLPQFVQYRNPTTEIEQKSVALPCRGENCYSVELRDNLHGLCLRCENKRLQKDRNQQQPRPISSGISNTQRLPLIAHSVGSVSSSESDPITERSRIHAPETTSYERELHTLVKCSFPACDNPGLETTNGLCQVCFDVLARERNIPYRSSNISKLRKCVTEPKARSTSPQPLKNTGSNTLRPCITTKCEMFGTRETDYLCSQCYSNSMSRKRKVSPEYGWWHNDEPVIETTTEQRHEHHHRIWEEDTLSPSITASPCKNHHCRNFGDPAFDGFCSKCYTKRDYRTSGYDTPDDGHRLTAKLRPQVSQQNTYSDTKVKPSSFSMQHTIAKCKNHRITSCPNYGNSDCRDYCNSCYVQIRSQLH